MRMHLKIKYSYLLTPKGIREKSMLANEFLARKKEEYKALRNEINQLEQEIGINTEVDNFTNKI